MNPTFPEPILVGRPALPPFDRFRDRLAEIWQRRWLTNSGPVHQELEARLAEYCRWPHLALAANGTWALSLAMQALEVSGQVITTPFTFIATTHALTSNGCRPVFVDIDPDTYNLDPARVEQAVTPQTTAILAVHCYGIPCDHAGLQAVADKHGLKLIYDAAHAFGVEVDGQSIAALGDAAMFSFHATKVFNTFEGGMLACRDEPLKQHVDRLKNFGYDDGDVTEIGTNAKLCEVQALMGLLLLDEMDAMIEHRRRLDATYRQALAEAPGLRVYPLPPTGVRHNYAYMPVEVDPEAFGMTRDDLIARLKEHNVFARPYFSPVICDFECYRNLTPADPLTHARRAAQRVVCLPIDPQLTEAQVIKICELMTNK